MKVFNTMSAQKEEFRPFGSPVKVYVCGITPYAEAHIGHAMSYIIFDVILRYLEFRGYDVRHVQNFTDIDDKIIARAQAQGVEPGDLAQRFIDEFFADMEALNVRKAGVYPRATQEIPKIIEVIQGLIDKGHAYLADGDVYFRVNSKSDYGKLSHRSLEEMQAGARIEVDLRKENPMDFALWKASKPGEPWWESPWSKGRPGWHIECSAMILRYLGPRIDIHGGGQDLIFPHHENEIAQSECFTGEVPFVKYWMHNGLLQLGGEKMSKSLGNLISVREALAKSSADAIRLFVLSSHYRAPLTYGEEVVQAAEKGVERLRAAAQGFDSAVAPGQPTEALREASEKARANFVQSMDDDFNTAAALAGLFDLVKEINRAREQGVPADSLIPAQKTLVELAHVLGFTLVEARAAEELAAKPFIELLIGVRRDLRQAKQWALADRIRDQLSELGVALEDRPEGTVWRDQGKD
ncbi:MAG: cysteine--tRNA ligase [Chloroflexi bacterium]|nr:cysteine--tRNA ligase [Chloroflexota bacterium]